MYKLHEKRYLYESQKTAVALYLDIHFWSVQNQFDLRQNLKFYRVIEVLD